MKWKISERKTWNTWLSESPREKGERPSWHNSTEGKSREQKEKARSKAGLFFIPLISL
jgi:hypothetical protein